MTKLNHFLFLHCLFWVCVLQPVLAQTATPITFDEGRTQTMVAGKVPENSMQVFTVEGFPQQPMGLYLMSADSNAEFELTAPSGKVVAKGKRDKFGARAWKGLLPEKGLYTVVVFSKKGLADFQLSVEMP